MLVPTHEVPITFGGRAAYNVENVLGAVALAKALWIEDKAITRGLRTFGMKDNPGRGQLYTNGSVQVLLDFGHNTDGMRSFFTLARSLREGQAGRLFVIAASPGDRTDAELEEMVQVIANEKPHRTIVRMRWANVAGGSSLMTE